MKFHQVLLWVLNLIYFLLILKLKTSNFTFFCSWSTFVISVQRVYYGFFFFKKKYFLQKNSYLHYHRIIKWKILYINNLLNLIICMTCIVSLIGWSKLTFAMWVWLVDPSLLRVFLFLIQCCSLSIWSSLNFKLIN